MLARKLQTLRAGESPLPRNSALSSASARYTSQTGSRAPQAASRVPRHSGQMRSGPDGGGVCNDVGGLGQVVSVSGVRHSVGLIRSTVGGSVESGAAAEFAVTKNPDGTVDVTLSDLSDLPALNQGLAQDGIPVTAVPLSTSCSVTAIKIASGEGMPSISAGCDRRANAVLRSGAACRSAPATWSAALRGGSARTARRGFPTGPAPGSA
jgi:hypothetical protein